MIRLRWLAEGSSIGILDALTDLRHDGIDLLVAHRALRILEVEGESIALLPCRKVLPLIHVEEGDITQELLLCTTSGLSQLCKGNLLVEEEREVTTYDGELRQVSDLDLHALSEAIEVVPVDLGVVDRDIDIPLSQQGGGDLTKKGDSLSVIGSIEISVPSEEVSFDCLSTQTALAHTESLEEVQDVRLELEGRSRFISVRPAALYPRASDPQT